MASFGKSVIQIHLWLLFIFVILKCILDFNVLKMHTYSIYFVFLFSVLFFIYLFAQNMIMTKDSLVCGKENTRLGFYATVFPYVFIYMLGMMIVHLFPGWLRSFSNTFGLTVVRMCGYDITVSEIFKQRSNEPANATASSATGKTGEQIIDQLYNDPDVFINELDLNQVQFVGTNNDEIQWDSLYRLKEELKNDMVLDNQKKKDLIGYLNIKDTVATYIWVGMLSTLTILVAQNRLLAENCTSKVENTTEFQEYLATQLKA
jgi:hypothetical protein